MTHRRHITLDWISGAYRWLRSGSVSRPNDSMDMNDEVAAETEAADLESFAAGFEDLVGGLEERFLPLGQDLGEVFSHLQRLVAVAEEGFASLRGEIADGALGELDVVGLRSIESVQTQLSEVSRRMQPLEEVSADLTRLRSQGNEFKRIGAFLRACGSNFAIESARREENQRSFAGFVVELRELAARIGDLSERMDEASRSTLKQLNDARVRIHENLGKVDSLAGAMHGAFSTASGEIRQILSQMRGAMDRVDKHRKTIGKQAGNVVYYLQFGDLIRQQCEHVVAAVRDACAAAISEDEDERMSLPLIVRTAVSQMELIQHGVNEARERLLAGYGALEQQLTQLAECGSDLGCGSASSGGNQVWTRLKNQLGQLDEIQQQERNLSADARATAGEAGAAVSSLHAGLSGVREVSNSLHFLALNAIVQTARLGDHGRTLEELAKHVNGLHRDCEFVVPKVIGLLDSIDVRVSLLTEGENIQERLDLNGVQQMERVQAGSRDVMASLLELTASGNEKLARARAGLEMLTELSSEIAEHRTLLKAIQDRLPMPRRTAATAEIEARLQKRYTMKSERDAHQRAQQQSSGAAVDDFEMFSSADDPAGELAAAGGDDLGDNIELF
jgi:hypothetical protein